MTLLLVCLLHYKYVLPIHKSTSSVLLFYTLVFAAFGFDKFVLLAR